MLLCWLGEVEAFFTKQETQGGSLQGDEEQGSFERDVPEHSSHTDDLEHALPFPSLISLVASVFIIFPTE